MFAFVVVVVGFFFFFTFFSCKMLFSHICLLITVKLWKRLKKKKIFHIVGCQYAWSSKARLKLIQHSVTVFGSVITLR